MRDSGSNSSVEGRGTYRLHFSSVHVHGKNETRIEARNF